MKRLIRFRGKLYKYNGFGYGDCPVCKKEFDYEYDKAVYISKPMYCLDSFSFEVFVKCKNCGKRYCFTDGN